MNGRKLLLFMSVIIAITISASFALLSIMSPARHTQANYEKAISVQLDDKCATPPGYTDESWKEHMSHHPDMYEECL